MDDGSLQQSAGVDRRAMGWLLTSPVFVVAVVTLVVNDQLLKREWPGLITGKLSDVAGVAMVAMLVASLTRRPAASCAGVAVAFTFLKTVSSVADVAVPVLGGRTLTDPTDLVALAVLVPLWRWMRADGMSPPVRSSRSLHTAVAMAKVIGVGVAVVATSASSCAPVGADGVAVTSEGLVVDAGFERFVSSDGGRTWTPDSASANGAVSFPFARSACDVNGCYELVDNGVVRVEPGGDEVAEFVVTDQELSNLVGNLVDSCSFAGSVFSQIAVVDGPDGPNVVVTMGEYGVLHRSADGDWSWRDVGQWSYDGQLGQDPEAGRISGGTFAVLALVAAGVAVIAGVAGAVASARRGQGTGWVVAQIIGGVVCGLAIVALLFFMAVWTELSRPRGAPYWALLLVAGPLVALGVISVLVQLYAPRRVDDDRVSP